MSTALAICGVLIFIAVILFIASELGKPEREPDIDWVQLEGDLSEYVRRRNGEAM